MEHYFRIALWTFFLIGYLQAVPVQVPSKWIFNMADAHIKEQRQVKCSDSLKFTSPAETIFPTDSDKEAAVLCYKQGFEKASNNCTNTEFVEDALGVLERMSMKDSGCSGETKITNYQEFVNKFESFLQVLNQ